MGFQTSYFERRFRQCLQATVDWKQRDCGEEGGCEGSLAYSIVCMFDPSVHPFTPPMLSHILSSLLCWWLDSVKSSVVSRLDNSMLCILPGAAPILYAADGRGEKR